MNVRVVQGSNNQVAVTTSAGVQLVGTQASQLSFNQTGTMSAGLQWNADPTKSGLGTITSTSPSGATTDLIAGGALQSGEIAGYVNMRDKVLVQAQGQLDEIAAQMSSALSDTTTAGLPSPAASMSISAACRMAIISSLVIPTRQRPAQSHRSCGSTIRRPCHCRIRRPPIRTTPSSASIFRRSGVGGNPAQHRARRRRTGFFQYERLDAGNYRQRQPRGHR